MRPQAVILAALLCALQLAGCITKDPPTPDEIRAEAGTLAEMDLNRSWRAGNSDGTGAGPVTDNWLATFVDPQLDALIAEAMANNPNVRIAGLRVQIAAQQVELAKAEMRPQINVLGTGGLNMGGGDVSSALQGISLGASWEPDLWARMRYGKNAAEANYASVRADAEFARQSLAAVVAKGWFTSCETSLQLQIAEDMAATSQELATLADTRFRVGPGSEEDVALANANVGKFQDVAKQVRLAHEQSLRALEVLLGRYPSAELATRSDLAGLPGPVPAGLPIEMLKRRPDMIAAERRVAAAFNRVGEAKAARLPRIILNANIAAIESDILQLKDDLENPTGGVGAKLIAPIYTGGRLTADIEIRTLEQKEAVVQYARIALRSLADVEGALAAGRNLADRVATLTRIVSDHERVLALARTNYRVGSGDLRPVHQQQVSVQSARLELLRVRSEQLAQRINLHLALGGSFEAPHEPVASNAAP